MRALYCLSVAGFLLAPVAAAAGPAAQRAPLDLPLQMQQAWKFREAANAPARLLWPKSGDAAVPPSQVHVGPIVFESRARQAGHYRIEGMEVMGASLSGAVDGRGARIELNWRDGN